MNIVMHLFSLFSALLSNTLFSTMLLFSIVVGLIFALVEVFRFD